MSEQQQNPNEINVNKPSKSLHTDNAPVNQPENTYRFMLNGVSETSIGDNSFSSNEGSNINITSIPPNYIPIGDKYMEDNSSALILCNKLTNQIDIGILDKNNQYISYVNTGILNMDISHQVDMTFRVRRSGERVIYWVDGKNRPRTFNFDKPQNFYSKALKTWLTAGFSINTFVGEKWDASSFDLIKSYNSIPFFAQVEVIETGNIKPGSYSFAIQYVDDDFNSTAWLTTSNPVNIFNDTTTKTYYDIRGSRNTQVDSQNFGPAPKSIKITLNNLDKNFPFYRVAVIQSNNNTGKPNRALVLDLLTTDTPFFIYSGNDSALTEVSLDEILIDPEVINAPKHIEQIENRLILANSKNNNYNYCDFQKYASKIVSNYVTKSYILNDVNSDANQKNPNNTFLFRGYMPGEVYSFGICYLLKDGSITPVFHIPGKVNNANTNMEYHEGNYLYPDIHNCYDGNNYWGLDASGSTLVNKEVRHHRFPDRRKAGLKLIDSVDSTVNITKYYLRFKLTLKAGKSYPLDTAGNPKNINFVVQYRPSYSSSPLTYSSYISNTDMGNFITFYDNTYSTVPVSGSDHIVFDPTCELISIYMQSGNEYFDIVKEDGSYIAQSVTNAITSKIMGIKFSAIEKPHPDVVGFYIVRHERFEEDKLVLDNVLLGPTLQNGQYKAFGLWIPKVISSLKHARSMFFWSAEHQFFNKKLNFDKIHPIGIFDEGWMELAPRSYTGTGINTDPIVGVRAVLVNDVYPGTSYTSEIHKKKSKDVDGFSLAVGYRNYNCNYFSYPKFNPGDYVLPTINEVIYLDACAYKSKGSDIFYNTSCDNKIGIIHYNNDYAIGIFNGITSPDRNSLVYATLYAENNKSSYTDFITRPYYKEHNNIALFGNNNIINDFQIFNGDAYISGLALTSSVFWEQRIKDRDKKSKVWQIIVGVVLIIVGVIVAIFTAGAGLTISAVGLGVIGALAIAYGVSLAMSGIKFEQMKNMIDNDYPKGLKNCVMDQDTVYSMDGISVYPGPRAVYPSDLNGESDDDMFMWFSDRVSGVYVESSIPIHLRVGLTYGTPDFINAPQPYFNSYEFQTYLTEKFTVLDKDRGSGRLYKGYPSSEIYDANLDYMRFNKEKVFYHLPVEYDCCDFDVNKDRFFNRVWYSQQSFQEEKTDNFSSFLPNNYRDIEAEHGEITDLYRIGTNLFIHTKECLWQLPQNIQERVTDEIISFVGTGSFFSVPPRKVLDDTLGSAGTQDKWATVKTKHGVFFASEIEGKVYLHTGDNLRVISNEGNSNLIRSINKSFLGNQFYELSKENLPTLNNPTNPFGVGLLGTFDYKHQRYIITKKDYLLKSQYTSTFKVVDFTGMTTATPSDYDVQVGAIVFNKQHNNFVLILSKQFIWAVEEPRGTIYYYTYSYASVVLEDTVYFENKSWTLSYSIEDKWKSFHSYLPNYYISQQNKFFSYVLGQNFLWLHNSETSFQRFYNILKPHIIEFVSVSNPLTTRLWDSLILQTTAQIYDNTLKQFNDAPFITFDKLTVYNNYQCSGRQNLIVKDTESNQDNFMFNQIRDRSNGNILITRKERNWCINDLRDYRVDYTKPIWSTRSSDVFGSYYIDKVLTTGVIDFNKNWTEIESFRDKYIVMRFEFTNFDNVKLTTNYILDSQQQSLR